MYNILFHPHVHMIVPGGGIDPSGNWIHCHSDGKYLFPVRAMSAVYRGKFIEKFKTFLIDQGMELTPQLRHKLYEKPWVVYAKRPFGGPDKVIEYLGRYSHKIAISNHRLQRIDGGKVSFSYKDYRNGAKTKIMTLEATEFLRRFCMHNLSRHSGFYQKALGKLDITEYWLPETRLNSENNKTKWVLLKRKGQNLSMTK